MSQATEDRDRYVRDPRIPCKYGTKCYQKNPIHHTKYKHPAKRTLTDQDNRKRQKIDLETKPEPQQKANDISDSEDDAEVSKTHDDSSKELNNLRNSSSSKDEPEKRNGSKSLDSEILSSDKKTFIKSKFLVEMPEDFYNFWEFCKTLNKNNPLLAFKDVGLTLVGPFDVLSDTFKANPEKKDEEYLLHWRYFYDPPEFQTILKGDSTTGYHIGYVRDSPQELPVFLASNLGKCDGTFSVIGDNVFAAVNLHLEELKKKVDPFKRIHIPKLQSLIKVEAEKLNYNLSRKTDKMRARERKVVTTTFNKIGLVVPYDRKTQLGYRELAASDKELKLLLNKIDKATPEQRDQLLSELQTVLTYASIATDECDFGTGLELGLDILSSGVESLNSTIQRFLATSYRLLDREPFALIAEVHMNNRKKGCELNTL